jgi:hypothetical protein
MLPPKAPGVTGEISFVVERWNVAAADRGVPAARVTLI